MAKKEQSNKVVVWGSRAFRRLVGQTSAEKRETFITWYMGPLVARLMRKNKRIKAVYLAFAQYWNDEANDAVHYVLAPVADVDIPYEQSFTPANKLWKVDKDGYGEFKYSKYEGGRAVEEEIHGTRWGFHWDNVDAIKAFAAYTDEDGSQERGYEQYTPYMKFYWREEESHAAKAEQRFELVGEILTEPLRPWLDDTKTEWEEEEDRRGEGENTCDNCGLQKDQHADGGQCLFEAAQYSKDPDSPFWFRKPIED